MTLKCHNFSCMHKTKMIQNNCISEELLFYLCFFLTFKLVMPAAFLGIGKLVAEYFTVLMINLDEPLQKMGL